MLSKKVYSYWFLQFEYPNESGNPYKSSNGEMVWNDELEKEIPKGWSVGRIESLGEIVAGGTPSTKVDDYYCEKGIAWITPNDLAKKNTMYISHGDTDITEVGLRKSSAKLMPQGSVLLTSRAPIGYLAIADNELCTNQGFKSIVPRDPFGTQYIYYTILSLIPYLKSIGSGSTFTEISKDVVSNVKIVIPDEFIVKRFNKSIEDYGKRIRLLEKENDSFIGARDSLLPLFMNGKISCEC